MRLSWSFLRLVLLLGCWVMGSFLLEQATGEQAEDIARSLGVADVNDWDIRSLYRVRFQHITKRPPPAQRAVERKSKLATRWAALRERLADFFPSRHTNPRTVVTFDKIATDFVNVGIVKLAKALDPPKSTPKSRTGKKTKATTVEPARQQDVSDVEPVDVPEPTKLPRADGRPKRRVTLLLDLPDFDLQDFAGEVLEEDVDEETRQTVPGSASTPRYPSLPEAPQKLVAESPCAGDVGTYGGEPESTAGGSAYLSRRKRGWSWSSGTTKKVTKRPIGWSFDSKQQQQQQKPVQKYYPTQQTHYVPPQQKHYVPSVQEPYQPSSITVNFGRPTKSLTRQLVKAAFVVGVAGAASAYAKPVRPSTKSPAQREEEREKRRQQRLSRRSTTTTAIAPTTEVDGGNLTTTTTTAVPLAASELIPVVVQDANKLLQIVYVRRDQIPPGGMPIAIPQIPFPAVGPSPPTAAAP
uniref:Uncharacterized protein n=1 Tax=Anopheles dirus TaxID=7168 RepID=A0A182NES3_9DIPT